MWHELREPRVSEGYPFSRQAGLKLIPASDFAIPFDEPSTSTPSMKLPLILYSVLGWLIAEASATALTYKLGANEKACFYTVTKNKGEKIAFYFAVCKRASSR